MFASRTKKVISVEDGDSTVEVTIQKLSARSLEKAAEARQIAVGAVTRNLGSEIMRSLRDLPDAPKKELTDKEKREARFSPFDRDHVLSVGIVSWTSEKNLKEGIPDLDEETSKLLFEAILEMSLPSPEATGKD